MHFVFNRYGLKSRMRINYRVNDNPTSGHLDGLCSPPAENFLNSLKIKYECQGLAWVERGGGGGVGGWAQVVELTDA